MGFSRYCMLYKLVRNLWMDKGNGTENSCKKQYSKYKSYKTPIWCEKIICNWKGVNCYCLCGSFFLKRRLFPNAILIHLKEMWHILKIVQMGRTGGKEKVKTNWCLTIAEQTHGGRLSWGIKIRYSHLSKRFSVVWGSFPFVDYQICCLWREFLSALSGKGKKKTNPSTRTVRKPFAGFLLIFYEASSALSIKD